MSATGLHDRSQPSMVTAGFTLLEMLVVLAIAALISGIVYPAVERAIDRSALQSATRAVMLALRTARGEAIRRDTIARFSVAPDHRRFAVGDTAPENLPANVTLACDCAAIRFYNDGSATPARLTITSGATQVRLRLEEISGEARLEP